jgi:hypothetical protein
MIMKKVNLFLSASLMTLITVSSCGENTAAEDTSSEQSKESDEKEQVEQKQTEEVNEDLLVGAITLVIDGEEYTATEFDKNRSEITWMNDNKIALRLGSLDKGRNMKLLISGDNAYGEKPYDITLDASQYEKADHGSLSFSGFLGELDNLSTTQLQMGQATVSKLDATSLEFSMSFDGKGIHTAMGGVRDTVSISGDIAVQFDNAVDSRTK